MHPEQMMQLANLRHQEALAAAAAGRVPRRQPRGSFARVLRRSGGRGGFSRLWPAAAMRKRGDAVPAARQPAPVRSATPERSSMAATEREPKPATDLPEALADLRPLVTDGNDQASASERSSRRSAQDQASASERSSPRSAPDQAQRARNRDDDRRRPGETRHVPEIAHLPRVSASARHLEVRPTEPERLRVLRVPPGRGGIVGAGERCRGERTA
jgi:hypothetical protein